MNEIIPRIDRNGNGRVTIVGRAVNRTDKSVRSGHSVIPRFAGRGGVSASVVLSNSGIARGGLVRVTAYNPDKEREGIEEAARRKAAKAAEERRKEAIRAEAAKRAAVKFVSKVAEKPRYISGHGFRVDIIAAEEAKTEGQMSPTEERLADLLAAAQEVKPMADERAAGTGMAEKGTATGVLPELKAAEKDEMEGRTDGAPKVEETGAIIPELPLGETTASTEERTRKKKRGRKGKKVKAAMMAAEQETL